ncbi:MIP/aquaporin family protein [Calorimonas adulescens]|jgi:MIP family channel proteins|uniref:Aquaporin family protein n=1 Tax=Calorimonas adulescens TaxID=2606906 RepID=A0A5D8QET6_9THEO|nr:MIP/aquaporin family protein [Calorimonas adulescens]TZE83011.1 aquaporin family protein [Calorimonas adulescens]
MSPMTQYLAEFFGTMILVLLGDGVVANVVLNKSKGQNSGWIVITAGWGFAVAVAAYITGWVSGAHLNPAVTIGLAAIGKFSWSLVPGYIVAQVAGAFVGAVLVYIMYMDHFAATDDPGSKLGVFSTIPAIRNIPVNFISEVIGTAMLVIGILGITNSNTNVGSLGTLLVGLLVFSIGLSLGGPTGYAINPARDLGPRIAHAILPIPGKGSSDWGYGLIVPIFGPVIGGILGAFIYQMFI